MGASGGGMNAARALQLNELQIRELVMVRQEHTRDILVLDEYLRSEQSADRSTDHSTGQAPELAVLGTADGVICNGRSSHGLWLGVTVADCVPIFLSAGAHGPCALLHSGRKGTGIVLTALQMMQKRYGVEPAELDVMIGPAIGACCYQVGEECARSFAAEWGTHAVKRWPDGPHLDLPHLNQELALGYGVKRVHVVERCTRCDNKLGSYRREGPDNYTRMLALLQVGNNTL
ncbi:MAG: laccase domain-containing protein [Spirochaetaceae bacterium]|nr:MAG: laccase domain-containing protein [Spirochaetaceae bacterium]